MLHYLFLKVCRIDIFIGPRNIRKGIGTSKSIGMKEWKYDFIYKNIQKKFIWKSIPIEYDVWINIYIDTNYFD